MSGAEEMEEIMSAATSWDAAPVVGRPAPPELYLVPTGRDALPATRMTRFGRLLVGIGILLAATMLAVTLVGAAGAETAIDHVVRVTAGQTLSEVAVRELPQLPVAEGVAQIQLANALSSSHVHAGQELKIPRVG